MIHCLLLEHKHFMNLTISFMLRVIFKGENLEIESYAGLSCIYVEKVSKFKIYEAALLFEFANISTGYGSAHIGNKTIARKRAEKILEISRK